MAPATSVSRWSVVPELRSSAAVLLLFALIGAVATLRPPRDRAAPAPMPAARAEGWMADAIPGVGPKRRDAVAEGIRAGRIPPAAQDWFTR